MRLMILIVCLAAAFGCGNEDDDGVAPREEQCTRLREHRVDLRLRTVGRLSADELEQHRAAMSNALGEQFVKDCAQNMTPAQLGCELTAEDADTATECARALGTN